ncbi:related to PSF2 - part of GINS, replication multiprotein complex [Ustilago trichophora]|uniref:DNA replication complex GINS protein PSF2 n=1 Tax=Ustilago trichophora TaxID=86804 RepID=A0A5C3DVS1_9BASI|nr:related to PSF2 - part of GINS, replication multiprotein complex [Ustilago trichophora]
MSSSFASASSAPGSVASSSLSVSSHARGCSATDLDLATTSLSSTYLTIIPLTSVDRVRLLSGIYGPFRPPQPCSVPLWVALHLKKRKKAILVAPTWLTVDALTETLKQETTQPGFSPLPHYWIGVSHTLLSHASDDIPNSNRVRALLKDIREARQSKILSGVSMINSVHLQMHNISAHEVAELRGFFSTAFSHLKSLRPPSEVEAETKLQAELDVRNRWLLMPSLPSELQGNELAMGASQDSISRSYRVAHQDESMNTSFTDDSAFYVQSESSPAQGKPRKSNVSDSGYHSAPIAARSTSPQQQAQQPQPPAQFDSSHSNRPPRFAVDDQDEDE